MNGNALGLIETLGLVGLDQCGRCDAQGGQRRAGQLGDQAGRRHRERDGPGRRQQRAGRGRGRRRGRRPDRRAQGRPRHSPARSTPSSARLAEGARGEGPRRQPGQHQLQVPPLRPERPGRAGPARGAIERIGSPTAKVVIKSSRGERELVCPIADHGEAVQLCLDQLTDPEIGVLHDAGEVSAIGFKAVHARNLTGVHLVDETVLAAMEAFADVAPAHNPPYTKAMRMLRERFPRAAAGRRLRDRLSPHDPRGHCSATPSPTSGRPSSASAAGDSTAPAIATSPAGCPSCWDDPTSS